MEGRCLRCNREAREGQVFCDECLAQMEKQPVKPGTPVNLPIRPPSQPRAAKHTVLRPEDQIAVLEQHLAELRRIIAMLVIAMVLISGFLTFLLMNERGIPAIGQNYTPMESTAAAFPTAFTELSD